MDALDAIFARRSIGRLGPPAPSEDELRTILAAATAAPDHESLRPWRFVVLEGAAKDAFG
ncbi:MAG: nitroreductase family protein, partial [Acidimicrobiales bacterium]